MHSQLMHMQMSRGEMVMKVLFLFQGWSLQGIADGIDPLMPSLHPGMHLRLTTIAILSAYFPRVPGQCHFKSTALVKGASDAITFGITSRREVSPLPPEDILSKTIKAGGHSKVKWHRPVGQRGKGALSRRRKNVYLICNTFFRIEYEGTEWPLYATRPECSR